MVVVSAAIIISKFLDCWTTSIKITNVDQEANPLARKLFGIFGSHKTIWFIFGISVLIVSLSHWLLLTFYHRALYKILYIIIGLIVSIVQLAVAHTNWTRRLNFFTKILMKRYSKYG